MLGTAGLFALLLCCTLCQSLPVNTLQCANPAQRPCGDDYGMCVDPNKVCNGVEDCPEGTDEHNCHEELPTLDELTSIHFLICAPDQFRCFDGMCIDRSLACNGASDCSGGEDESNQCNDCNFHGCSHYCQDFPTGPKCYCKMGFVLSMDDKTCEFEDKCNTSQIDCRNGGACRTSHETNEDGVPVCDCPDGFGGSVCELELSMLNEKNGHWVSILILMFLFVAIVVSVSVFVLRMNPELAYKYERFANASFSPSVDRLRESIRNKSPRQLSGAGTTNTSPLLKEVCTPNAKPFAVRIRGNFSNPSFDANTQQQPETQRLLSIHNTDTIERAIHSAAIDVDRPTSEGLLIDISTNN